jgi:transcriptional regulator with XRE-family HTH domain
VPDPHESNEAVPAPTWAQIYSPAQLGRFVAGLRRARGMTQAQLADELGVTRQYVSDLERGVSNLYTERLFSLLRLLEGSLQGRYLP